METNKVVITTTIEHCVQCPYHLIVPDPDPDDWFEDDETKKLTTKLSTAKALDEMTEIYVIDSDFSWTYIKTHESMCGPYFMKL